MINKVDEVGSSGLIVLERRGASTYLEECSISVGSHLTAVLHLTAVFGYSLGLKQSRPWASLCAGLASLWAFLTPTRVGLKCRL